MVVSNFLRRFGAHLEALVTPGRQPAGDSRLCRRGTVVSHLRASAALSNRTSRSTCGGRGYFTHKSVTATPRLRLGTRASSQPMGHFPSQPAGCLIGLRTDDTFMCCVPHPPIPHLLPPDPLTTCSPPGPREGGS